MRLWVSTPIQHTSNSRLEYANHTLFQPKTTKKTILFGAAPTYISHTREYRPPPPHPHRQKGGLKRLPRTLNSTSYFCLASLNTRTSNFTTKLFRFLLPSCMIFAATGGETSETALDQIYRKQPIARLDVTQQHISLQ